MPSCTLRRRWVMICNRKEVYSLYKTPDKIVTFLAVLLHNNYTNMNKDLSSVASSLYDNNSFYVLSSIAYLTEIVTAKTSLHCKMNCVFLCYSYMSFASNYTYQAKISYPCSLFFLLPSQ